MARRLSVRPHRYAARVAFLAAAFAAGCVPARAETLSGPVAADVIRVIDGDTLALRARIWIGLEIVVNARIRGIDAPELRGRCTAEKAAADTARAHLAALVGDGGVRLRRIENDKYAGRVLADVVTDGGIDLAEAMFAAGVVRPYDGGGRAPWCDVAGLPQ